MTDRRREFEERLEEEKRSQQLTRDAQTAEIRRLEDLLEKLSNTAVTNTTEHRVHAAPQRHDIAHSNAPTPARTSSLDGAPTFGQQPEQNYQPKLKRSDSSKLQRSEPAESSKPFLTRAPNWQNQRHDHYLEGMDFLRSSVTMLPNFDDNPTRIPSKTHASPDFGDNHRKPSRLSSRPGA